MIKYIIFVSFLFSGLFYENVNSLTFHLKHISSFNNNYLDFLSEKNRIQKETRFSKNNRNIKFNKKTDFNDDWPVYDDDDNDNDKENNNNNIQNKRRAIIFLVRMEK